MIDCISVENMRLSDARTIADLVPGVTLMYRAALGIFRAVSWHGTTAIVVGSGNNGGDGFALACILKEQGHSCAVFTLSEKRTPDSAHFSRLARENGIPIRTFTRDCLEGFDFVVDCLLGTGFRGTVRGDYRTAIEAINRSRAFVVSADINSGMNGDTGQAELAVVSDLTVTIGFVKRGLIRECAGTYIKKLVCTDIGIVLLREEDKIYGAGEVPCPGAYPCPPWLDMDIICCKE